MIPGGHRIPLPWELDPSKHTVYDEELLKDMINLRAKYDAAKREREAQERGEDDDWGSGRKRRHGRTPPPPHKPMKKARRGIGRRGR